MDNELRTLDQVRRTAITLAMQFGPKVLVALLLIGAGLFAGHWTGRLTDTALRRLHLEPPVRQLLVRSVRLLVIGLFAIMALQNIGVQLLPLIAGLGVAGAGVALAMQGVLGNLVAGLTIIFTKPFRVGEYVSIAGEEGLVESISLSTTVLSHPDRSLVVIPNRKIVGEILHNYGNLRQLDVAVSVGLDADLNAALAAIDEVVRANPRVLADPKPVIAVGGFAPGAIAIAVKPWVSVRDFGAAGGELTQAIVEIFRARGIAIPLPQQEVRMRAAG
jgi:small conductance mechanosensitive channel